MLELEQGPPEAMRTLWYEKRINRFADEDGYILQDLSPYFDTWQLDKWKKNKDYDILIDKAGEAWEVFYNDICDHKCATCSLTTCEIYDLVKD